MNHLRPLPVLSILAGLLVSLVPFPAQADVAVAGGIQLHIGGQFLRLNVATTAPIIVYDGVYYQQAVQSTAMLVPVTKEIPATTAVNVPPNTTEIMVNGVTYPLEPQPVPRTIEIVTGTTQKVVYEPQTVESTVYVPAELSTVTGAVYFVPSTCESTWLQIDGVTIVAGQHRPHYVECKPPTDVVVVNGVWRYRSGKDVMPIRAMPREHGRDAGHDGGHDRDPRSNPPAPPAPPPGPHR